MEYGPFNMAQLLVVMVDWTGSSVVFCEALGSTLSRKYSDVKLIIHSLFGLLFFCFHLALLDYQVCNF